MKKHIKTIHKEVANDILLEVYWESDEQSNFYGCGNCKYETNSEKGLNLHIEDSQKLVYECERCHFKCKTEALLERHRKQKHQRNSSHKCDS